MLTAYVARPQMRPATGADIRPGALLWIHDGHPRAPWQAWTVRDGETPRPDPERPHTWLFAAALAGSASAGCPCRVPLSRIMCDGTTVRPVRS